MKITYLSHACLLVESDDKKVIIDPFLSKNPTATVDPANIAVDAVIITHGHDDHVGDAVAIAKQNECPIITNVELGTYLANQGVHVEPLGIGGSGTFHFGTVKLTHAFHGSGLEVNSGELVYVGMPTGVIVTMNNKTLYHAGDTGLFGDLKMIGDLNRIDVAALPIGDRFTMGIDDAIVAAQWLQAKKYIPLHYNTFGLIQQDPYEWKEKMDSHHLNAVVLPINGCIEI